MMMLVDKGYYDYDFVKPKTKPNKLTEEQKRIWSNEELAAVLRRAINPLTGESILAGEKPKTAEVAQQLVREEIKNKNR